MGIWVAVDGSSFSSIFGSSSTLQFVNVSYFLIVIGAILVVLGFLGCCGAQKESKCLLIMVNLQLWAAGSRARSVSLTRLSSCTWGRTVEEVGFVPPVGSWGLSGQWPGSAFAISVCTRVGHSCCLETGYI